MNPIFSFSTMLCSGAYLNVFQNKRVSSISNSKSMDIAFYSELRSEKRSLHGFAGVCPVEFMSALGAFGVRKLGPLQTSVQYFKSGGCILVSKQ